MTQNDHSTPNRIEQMLGIAAVVLLIQQKTAALLVAAAIKPAKDFPASVSAW